MSPVNLDRFLKTEKQKKFGYNFVQDAESYETWDEVEIGKEYTSPIKFEVKEEDIKIYSQGVMDSNPIFNDDAVLKKGPFQGIIPHPIFLTQIAFWCLEKGHGNWIRTPGARNPGQRMVWYEPIRPGDLLTLKMKSSDKWVKRGKYYLTYELDYVDQKGKTKGIWWLTLILPKTKEDIKKFMIGQRGVAV